MTNTLRPDQSMGVASREVPDVRPAGKPVELRELFAMHAPYVWNTLRRLGVAAPDLEDGTHDVFLQVHVAGRLVITQAVLILVLR